MEKVVDFVIYFAVFCMFTAAFMMLCAAPFLVVMGMAR